MNTTKSSANKGLEGSAEERRSSVAVALRAPAVWLRDNNCVPPDASWSWNPRQTGDHTEPDPAADLQGTLVVSAEITASADPRGVIDTRMANTLAKHGAMQGSKYYFARSEAMRRRAQSKVTKNAWPIRVISLGSADAL